MNDVWVLNIIRLDDQPAANRESIRVYATEKALTDYIANNSADPNVHYEYEYSRQPVLT